MSHAAQKRTISLLAAAAGLMTLALAAVGTPIWVVALLAAVAVYVGTEVVRRHLDAALQRLEADRAAGLRRREEQLANTAHELRTPLTAVTTAIELLRDGYATSPEDWSMFLDQATVAARHMAFLINDVVDLAALECGRISLHVRQQRVQELVFDVAQVMQLTAQQRNVELRIEEPPEDLLVQADRGRFLQVVFNLIGNAIKFSDQGDLVHLIINVDEAGVTFEVHDQGPGVEPEHRERLFTRFGRVHDRSRPAIGGTGLGLHVCKLLVDHMGGQIGHRPREGHGSVFWFSLPRPRPSSAGIAAVEVALPQTASA
ncbi:MAG: sensor histidine kinase [Planctomycetota bacterium]